VSEFAQIFGGGFNPDDHEPAADFDIIPTGDYELEVVNCEYRETRAGDGGYVWAELMFPEDANNGKFKNRKIWKNMNISNPNDTAEKIGRGELTALCNAAGITELNDPAELIGSRVITCVKCKKTSTGPENAVRTFKKIGAETATTVPKQTVSKQSSESGVNKQAEEVPAKAAESEKRPPWMQ
jgi:hypothetical protein